SALAIVATVAAATNGSALPSPRRQSQRSNPVKNRLPRRKRTALAYPIAFSANLVRTTEERIADLVRVHQRCVHEVFRQEPDLQLVGADHVADEQVVGPVVTVLIGLAGKLAGLLQDDLVRFQEP